METSRGARMGKWSSELDDLDVFSATSSMFRFVLQVACYEIETLVCGFGMPSQPVAPSLSSNLVVGQDSSAFKMIVTQSPQILSGELNTATAICSQISFAFKSRTFWRLESMGLRTVCVL